MTAPKSIGAWMRIGYSFLALLAGDVVLLLYLLQNAWQIRVALLRDHMGEPNRQIPVALSLFLVYAAVSVFGWLAIGLPLIFALPDRFFARLRLYWIVPLGAALGPFALLIFFVLLSRGQVSAATFRGTGLFWPLSVLVSLAALATYAILLRRHLGEAEPE